MRNEHKIAVLALFMIFGLEVLALSKGIDGVALSASIGGVGAIAGYVLKARKVKPRGRSARRK